MFNIRSSGSTGYYVKKALSPCTDISCEHTADGNLIKWTDPDDYTLKNELIARYYGTRLVRKEGSYPSDENDGTVVVDTHTRNQYKESALSDPQGTEESYYGLFPYTTRLVFLTRPQNCFRVGEYYVAPEKPSTSRTDGHVVTFMNGNEEIAKVIFPKGADGKFPVLPEGPAEEDTPPPAEIVKHTVRFFGPETKGSSNYVLYETHYVEDGGYVKFDGDFSIWENKGLFLGNDYREFFGWDFEQLTPEKMKNHVGNLLDFEDEKLRNQDKKYINKYGCLSEYPVRMDMDLYAHVCICADHELDIDDEDVPLL